MAIASHSKYAAGPQMVPCPTIPEHLKQGDLYHLERSTAKPSLILVRAVAVVIRIAIFLGSCTQVDANGEYGNKHRYHKVRGRNVHAFSPPARLPKPGPVACPGPDSGTFSIYFSSYIDFLYSAFVSFTHGSAGSSMGASYRVLHAPGCGSATRIRARSVAPAVVTQVRGREHRAG